MPATLRRKACLLLALAGARAHGQEVFSDPRQLITGLVENNPEIQAARDRYEAATKRPSQLGTLPDPRLSVTNMGVGHPFSSLNRGGFAYQALGVSQEIPFPGKLGLAAEEARREAEREGAMYRATILDLSARLKVAYYEWLAASKAIEITIQNRDLLTRMEEITRTRYAVGKGLQQDVVRAQVELTTLAQELELLGERRAQAEAAIAYLLGRPAVKMEGRAVAWNPSPFTMSLDALLAAVGTAPRVAAEQKLVDSRAVALARSRREYRPDFGVTFQWQHTGSQFPDYYMAEAEMKIPIHYARKQRYAVEESAARLAEARHSYEAARNAAIFDAKQQYLAIRSSERVLELYKSASMPQTSIALESTLSSYQVGNTDFLNVVSASTNVLTQQRQYYEQLARHESALARLEPLVGHELTQFAEVRP